MKRQEIINYEKGRQSLRKQSGTEGEKSNNKARSRIEGMKWFDAFFIRHTKNVDIYMYKSFREKRLQL